MRIPTVHCEPASADGKTGIDLRKIMQGSREVSMSREYLFDKVVEVHKLRHGIQLGLLVALITLLQLNIDKKSWVLLTISLLIPPLALVIDIVTKYTYVSPFLYKGLSQCRDDLDSEPLELLFLSYGKRRSRYVAIITDSTLSNARRQRAFRSAYTWRHIVFKLAFYGFFVVGIWLYYKSVILGSSFNPATICAAV